MSEFNYIEYLRTNPLITENTKLTVELDNLNEDDGIEDYMNDMSDKYPGYGDSKVDKSALYKEKQMVMQQLLGNMQQLANENPEELTRDFLIKVKEVIDELMITDF